MPTPEPVADWRRTLIALAALDSGLLASFATGARPDDAARAAGLDPRAARIVATALVGSGHLEDVGDGLLRATPRGASLLAPGDDGGDPAGELFLEARSMASHLRLADTLRTGRPQDDVSLGGADERTRFMRAMRDVSAPRAAATIAAAGPAPPGARLLDVGGAPGTYARAFAAAGWDVTVTDLPETLAIGGPDLRAAGIATIPGDVREALPEGPWEAVYLGNVVHLFGPEEAAALVARAAAALAPGGLLAVQEVLGDRSDQGPAFGVMMLLSTTGGDAYAEADLRRWMEEAGCPPGGAVEVAAGEHFLLLGRRAG